MNRSALYLTVAATLLLPHISIAAGTDGDGDGIPDIAEPVLGTDPQNVDTDGDGVNDLKDKSPVESSKKLDAAGKPNAFAFTGKVEDNFDPKTKLDVGDHLELDVKNTAGEDLKNLVAFYTIKDDGTGKTESYYIPLKGLSLKAGQSTAVHFDDIALEGHFRDNPNSSYRKSENAKLFTVQLAAEGFAPVQIEIKKDKGGAEKKD
jgi:hypothetical protein